MSFARDIDSALIDLVPWVLTNTEPENLLSDGSPDRLINGVGFLEIIYLGTIRPSPSADDCRRSLANAASKNVTFSLVSGKWAAVSYGRSIGSSRITWRGRSVSVS